MTTPSSQHLKLHIEEADSEASPDLPAWDELQTSLQHLTGRQLECTLAGSQSESVTPLATLAQFYGADDGQLVYRPGDAASAEDCDPRHDDLARSISRILSELQATRVALRHRELELATAIPVIGRLESTADFNHRIQAVLRGAVEGLLGQAAALYLLDDETTELKLRSQWGLPSLRFLEPARPLRGALADLEALTGHAVVLEDTSEFTHWNVPEAFASAVCVPVSGEDSLLGTFWLFAGEIRDFSPRETQLLEIIAGRLAVELERRVILRDAAANSRFRNHGRDLESWHEDRTTQSPPLLDGWQVAGKLVPAAEPHGDFHSWHVSPHGHLRLASAAVAGNVTSSLTTAVLLQGATRAVMLGEEAPSQALTRINQALWSSSPDCQGASTFYGQLDPVAAEIRFASAGSADAYILRPHGWEPIGRDRIQLGVDPDWSADDEAHTIHPGDVLVVISDRHLARDEHATDLDTPALAEILLHHIHLSAHDLAALATKLIAEQCQQPWSRSVTIVKRVES